MSDPEASQPTDDAAPSVNARVRRLQAALTELEVPETVKELSRLDTTDRALAFRFLPKDRALEVFEDLEPALQRELITGLRENATLEILEGLDPDDRAGLLEEMPAAVVTRLLSGLSPHEQDMTTTLLGYPNDSVGRRMSPEVVSIPESATVGEALLRLRTYGSEAETIYMAPVVAPGRRVVGVVSLRRLFITSAETPVADVMKTPVMVNADEDQEVAAKVVRNNGMLAIPVVDAEQRLLGVLTVDDAMRVLEREESEDVALTGATAPLRRPYLSVRLFALVRSRLVWLLVLLFAATLTVGVLDHFEATLEQVVALALFIPLLIGTGGNAGSQAATTVVRAVAVGDVRLSDWHRVVGREAVTGALLGLVLAAIGIGPASFFAGWDVGLVLALSVVFICTLATTIGAIIPLIAARLGLDPAVVSAPFISTTVDATGLVVYFLIAQAVLDL